MPETVSLSREEHLALISGMADVTEAGFEIDDFGGNSVIVRAVPMWMEKADIAEMVGWMANAMIKGQNTSLPDFLLLVNAIAAIVYSSRNIISLFSTDSL